MKDQLTEAWNTNNSMNKLLIDHTREGAMGLCPGKSGRTIYQQWLHVINVRSQWIEVMLPNGKAANLKKESLPDRNKLKESLDDTSKAIANILENGWDKDGKLKSFKKGIFSFFAYLISHEAHHRGNVLLTMKLAGEKIPDSVKWGLWEWDK
jgi:uncharacterized damage-inducible protein DinB